MTRIHKVSRQTDCFQLLEPISLGVHLSFEELVLVGDFVDFFDYKEIYNQIVCK
jgi:hypothetical protein